MSTMLSLFIDWYDSRYGGGNPPFRVCRCIDFRLRGDESPYLHSSRSSSERRATELLREFTEDMMANGFVLEAAEAFVKAGFSKPNAARMLQKKYPTLTLHEALDVIDKAQQQDSRRLQNDAQVL
jgi:hypothetical protein